MPPTTKTIEDMNSEVLILASNEEIQLIKEELRKSAEREILKGEIKDELNKARETFDTLFERAWSVGFDTSGIEAILIAIGEELRRINELNKED